MSIHITDDRIRLNLDQLRGLSPDDYAFRLAHVEPTMPIILDGNTSLDGLRAALENGLGIDEADHARRLQDPDYDPTHGLDRINADHQALYQVDRCSTVLRLRLQDPYWTIGVHSTHAGRVAVAAITAMLDLADRYERDAIRWEQPLPVPTIVAELRSAVVEALSLRHVADPKPQPETDRG